MTTNEDLAQQRAAVFEVARRNFRVALAREGLTQNKVAAVLGMHPSTLSSKISKDHVTGFESLVVMPEMACVTVALLEDLVRIYSARIPESTAGAD